MWSPGEKGTFSAKHFVISHNEKNKLETTETSSTITWLEAFWRGKKNKKHVKGNYDIVFVVSECTTSRLGSYYYYSPCTPPPPPTVTLLCFSWPGRCVSFLLLKRQQQTARKEENLVLLLLFTKNSSVGLCVLAESPGSSLTVSINPFLIFYNIILSIVSTETFSYLPRSQWWMRFVFLFVRFRPYCEIRQQFKANEPVSFISTEPGTDRRRHLKCKFLFL